MNIDELIYTRYLARVAKNWGLSDEIRCKLDDFNVFVFDSPSGQQVYHFNDCHFKFKDKFPITAAMSNRQYVEYLIKRDIRANSNFDDWLSRFSK